MDSWGEAMVSPVSPIAAGLYIEDFNPEPLEPL